MIKKYRYSKAPFWRGLRGLAYLISQNRNKILVWLLILSIVFTVSVQLLKMGIDAEFERQDKVLENHFSVHGVERWKNQYTSTK